MKACTRTARTHVVPVLLGVACLLAAPAVSVHAEAPCDRDTRTFGWKLSTDPDDVMEFLNGTGAYTHPVSQAEIGAVGSTSAPTFYVFYERGTDGPAAGSWAWKLATSPDDARNFINGTSPYSTPVSNVEIAAVPMGSGAAFYVFYERGTAGPATGNFGWKLATTVDDAWNFVNGTGAYTEPLSHAEIAAVSQSMADWFYIFYEKSVPLPEPGRWGWKRAMSPDDAMDFLNATTPYTQFIENVRVGAVDGPEFFVFYTGCPGGGVVCEPAQLGTDLSLHIPDIVLDSVHLWADLEYVPTTDGKVMFEVTDYGVKE